MASKKINVVNEPSAISILDKSGQDPTTSNKKNRQTDVSTNGLPGVNDILTGKIKPNFPFIVLVYKINNFNDFQSKLQFFRSAMH